MHSPSLEQILQNMERRFNLEMPGNSVDDCAVSFGGEMAEPKSWRSCPFVKGRLYRVVNSFKSLRSVFVQGELLTFDREAYSIYDSCTGYFFIRESDGELRSLDLYDDETENWFGNFEAIAE